MLIAMVFLATAVIAEPVDMHLRGIKNPLNPAQLFVRQACNSATCPAGYLCCPNFPGSCCPAGVTCQLGTSGGVVCNINCTASDTTCQFGGCCPPGSVCDDLDLSCQSIINEPPPGSSMSFVMEKANLDNTSGTPSVPSLPSSPSVTVPPRRFAIRNALIMFSYHRYFGINSNYLCNGNSDGYRHSYI